MFEQCDILLARVHGRPSTVLAARELNLFWLPGTGHGPHPGEVECGRGELYCVALPGSDCRHRPRQVAVQDRFRVGSAKTRLRDGRGLRPNVEAIEGFV